MSSSRRKFIKASGSLSMLSVVPFAGFANLLQDHYPYYVPVADENVVLKTNPFVRSLILKGKVIDASSNRPIDKASVEIWHCDENGKYHNRAFRGRHTVVDDGCYQFKTLSPGSCSHDKTTRHKHIYFLVKAKGFEPLHGKVYMDSLNQAYIDGELWQNTAIGRLGDLPVSKKYSNSNIITMNFYPNRSW